jgi:hypothetical protein
MARGPVRSFVFAIDFRVPHPGRVWPVLEAHRDSLADIGAHYVFAYESTTEPGRVLVVIGVRTEQPLLALVRSRHFFVWFDAVGVDDIPAVFAGEIVERLDISDTTAQGSADIVVVAITLVSDVESFMAQVRASVNDFAHAGIHKTLVYQAFDNPCELMFLQQLGSQDSAQRWIGRPDIAAEWLVAAGVGAYPPLFVGRFAHAMRLGQTSRTSRR